MSYQLLPDLAPDEYESLKADIALRGVLVPIEYDEANNVLDGHHRLRICQELGIHEWPRVVRAGLTESQKFAHIVALNMARRHLNESQRAMVAAKVATMQQGRPEENAQICAFTQPEAAELLNVSTRSAQSARVVLDQGTPELVKAVEQGDIAVSQAAKIARQEADTQRAIVETIEADGVRPQEAARRVKAANIAKQEAAIPSGKYRVLYADPPWKYGNTQPDYHSEQRDHYPVMSIQELCALPVHDLAMDNAVLFLWATSPILEESFQVIRAWGFSYKTSFVWDKVKHNMGHYNSVRHELLLVCSRGSCQPDVRRLFDSVVMEERREHSRKPDIFYEIIETLYVRGPYLELFARGKRDGWETYGFEAG